MASAVRGRGPVGVALLPMVAVLLRSRSNPQLSDLEERVPVPWRSLALPATAEALATFCFLLSFYGLMTWLTKLMTQLDVPLSGAFQLTMLLNLGAVAGSVLTGLALAPDSRRSHGDGETTVTPVELADGTISPSGPLRSARGLRTRSRPVADVAAALFVARASMWRPLSRRCGPAAM